VGKEDKKVKEVEEFKEGDRILKLRSKLRR